MRLHLTYWNRIWQTVSFDPTDGACSVDWIPRRTARCFGWAFRARRHWYCLWRDGGELAFQVGAQRYPMNGEWQIDRRCDPVTGACVFSVAREGIVSLEVRYRAPGSRTLARHDPSWDAIDEEEADFFLWLARLSADAERRRALIEST